MIRQIHVIRFIFNILNLFSYLGNKFIFSKKISEKSFSTEKLLSYVGSYILSFENISITNSDDNINIYTHDNKLINSLSIDDREESDYFFYDIEC